jgi:hypothetical protein
MGRSRGSFVLPGVTPSSVLVTAQIFAADKKFRAAWTAPNQLMLWRGRDVDYVERRIVVTVFDGPQGAGVTIEAWIHSVVAGEQDANPKSIYNAVPRRQMWRSVARLLDALGASGAAAGFQHTG